MKRIIPDIHDFASQKSISVRRVLDFTTNVNPLGPSSRARNAIRKNIRMLDRLCDHSCRYLVRAAAGSRGVNEDNVAVSCDPGMLADAILRSFNVGTILVCAPYPSYYRDILRCPFDFRFVEFDEKEHFRFDIERWEEGLEGCEAAILSHPSFIAGEPLTPDDLKRILKIGDDRQIPIIIDETLIRYSHNTSLAGDLVNHPRCVVIYSLGEYHALAGLPVSFCIGDAAVLSGIRKRLALTGPSTLAAAAAVESLRDKSYPVKTREHFTHEGVFIEESLRKIPGISFYMTGIGCFVIEFSRSPSKPLDTFSRYNILVDVVSGSGSIYFPVKNHKWNARYLKTLKNIMGE